MPFQKHPLPQKLLSHYPDADTRRLPAYYETAMHGGRQMFYDFSPERSKYLKIECFQFHEATAAASSRM